MKRIHQLIGGNLLCMCLFASGLQAADGGARYTPQPTGNKIGIAGTSSMHDWLVQGQIIGGTAEFGAGFSTDPAQAKPGKVEAKVDTFIPVRALKSMKDGKPYSNAMDDIMYQHLKEAANKRITYKLTEMVLKEVPKAAGAPFLYDTKGDLTVAGTTKNVSMPVEMKVDGDKIRFSGKVDLKMTDFGVEPPAPALAGGLIKTGDDIKISIEWGLRPAPKK